MDLFTNWFATQNYLTRSDPYPLHLTRLPPHNRRSEAHHVFPQAKPFICFFVNRILSLSLSHMKSFHQDLRFIPKPSCSSLHLPIPLLIPSSSPLNLHQPQSFSSKFSNIHLLNSPKTTSFSHFGATHLKNFLLLTSLSSSFPFPSFAAEVDQVSDKINIESALVSIDDFFNRYPFFVAGCTFIWLVVIPLTEQYLKKYKFISAIDAYRKLRDLPNSQLLDIRKKQSINYLSSPNLKVLNKSVVHVEFVEEQEEGFAKEVLKRFRDPANTTLCVLDK